MPPVRFKARDLVRQRERERDCVGHVVIGERPGLMVACLGEAIGRWQRVVGGVLGEIIDQKKKTKTSVAGGTAPPMLFIYFILFGIDAKIHQRA